MNRVALGLILASCALAQTSPPATPKKPVTDTYDTSQGDRRLPLAGKLRRPCGEALGRRAERRRPRVSGRRFRIATRSPRELRQIFQPRQGPLLPHRAARRPIFAMKSDPQHQHQMVVTLASLDDLASEHTVLDPDALDAKHLTEIDFAVPSVDGRYLAASLSYRRQRERRRARVRNRHRQAAAGRHPARQLRHRGRRRGLERGQLRLLLHALSARRRARRPPTSTSISRSIFTSSGDKPEKDATRSARTFPRIAEISFAASQRQPLYRRQRGLSAMAAIMSIGCWRPGTPGASWPAWPTSVKQIAFGYQQGYLPGLQAWRARAARSCIWTWPRLSTRPP